jgi:phosphate-selective porin
VQTIYSVGLNWYPNRNVRFMFDYLHAEITDKLAGAFANTSAGGRFDAVAARAPVAF